MYNEKSTVTELLKSAHERMTKAMEVTATRPQQGAERGVATRKGQRYIKQANDFIERAGEHPDGFHALELAKKDFMLITIREISAELEPLTTYERTLKRREALDEWAKDKGFLHYSDFGTKLLSGEIDAKIWRI